MHYDLRPDRHADIARTLLERIYPAPLAAAAHQAWLDGQVHLRAASAGWDKHGPYELVDDSCIRGFDADTDHTRATLTITPVGRMVPIEETERQSLAWSPPLSPRGERIHRVLAEAIAAHDAGPHYGE